MNKANECTCPSGDGSLVHPCPAHPAVEQAGGDERAKFEYWASDEGIYPKAIERSGNCYKLAQTQSYWMAWQARAALAQPSPAQTQPSPAPTLRAAIDVANDRFEVPVAKWGTDLVGEEERPEVVAYFDRNYPSTGDAFIWANYEGSPYEPVMTVAQHERIVGELRAVIAQLRQHKNDYMDAGQETYRALQNEIREREAEIARLDGLVSGRTAERDAALVEVERLRESKGDPVGSLEKCMKVMYERDENAKRLEVALARVTELEGKLTDWVHEGFRLNEALAMASDAASKGDAARQAAGGMEMEIQELKAKLAEMEKQEPVATVSKVPGEDWNSLNSHRDLQHIQPGTKLYAAPVARAQHSVPEEFIGRLSEFLAQRGATGKALLRELRDMLAAAPGNSAQHSVPDGYRLIRLEHFAAIKAQLNPEQVDAYRGRNIYDEDKVYANWNACRSALDEIKDVFQQIDWDAENELAELLAAAPGKEVGHE
ncbi:TPA: hypothetical protein ACLG0X_000167 [Pseudomonas aeruginosa]|nr:hypothetical protein [Pseudomonas aeruginosa]